ncbi:hypothetical protein EUTSA_v10029536mg [Eutrema salsugineum]|uniref:RNA polymerase sigma-70 region 3 domain-containing protein n=1 Tax=Eutrema salsugineum TaxID=72664 RepID=V4L8C6_EUTSA|nr:hypothetical protein EUTSA_v10029536mg [Eutrema salsugineum]
MWELTAKVAEASNVLTRKLKQIPSCKEIAEHLNIRVSAFRLAVERGRSPVSLDLVASHNGSIMFFKYFLIADQISVDASVPEMI